MGRFPGAIELARPGRGSKAIMLLLSMNPRPGVTTPEPVPTECVKDTAEPSSASVETWVVPASGAAARSASIRTRRPAACAGSTSRAGRSPAAGSLM